MVISPQNQNWQPTLSGYDKIPYGDYVVRQELNHFFPSAELLNSNRTVFELLNNRTDSGAVYLNISSGLLLDSLDVDAMLDWAMQGNDVFLAAVSWSQSLLDSLGIGESESIFPVKDQGFNFTNPYLKRKKDFMFTGQTWAGYFIITDTPKVEILGQDHMGNADFIRVRKGLGALYLSSLPLVFSNYSVLYKDQVGYISGALSYLSSKANLVIWDEHYKPGSAASNNPMKVILQNPELKYAWWLALLTGVLLVVFGGKRTQRIIPVLTPPANTSLEFVETVGRLYYQRHDNKNLAEKIITQLLDQIRRKLHMQTGNRNTEFRNTLARKTRASPQMVNGLLDWVDQVQCSNSISDEDLIQLQDHVDQFLKTL